MKALMKLLLRLNILLLLWTVSSCAVFKTRTVNKQSHDSLSVSHSHIELKLNEKLVDTGSVKSIVLLSHTDSSTTETDIIPDGDVTVGKDGVFHGKAKSIHTKTTTTNKTNSNTRTEEKKGLTKTLQKDSTNNQDHKTEVKDSSKHIVSKPDFGWMIYAAAILAVLVILFLIYRKFRSKIPL
jgi:hypothetical protein